MSHDAAAHVDDLHAHDGHDSHPHVNYKSIFVALCVCTALSVVADKLMDWGVFSGRTGLRIVAVIVLAIAVAKAQYVMRYFMHLKFEGLWKYVLLLPTAILACGLPLALAPDIALHYYTPEHSLYGEPEEVSGHAAGHDGEATEEQGDHSADHDAAH